MPYPRNALLLAGSRMARSEMSCAESASVRSRRTVGVGLKAIGATPVRSWSPANTVKEAETLCGIALYAK
jgi:hypothetical protein